MGAKWGETGSATKIAVAYVSVSAGWILLTDWWLGLGGQVSRQATLVQSAKGLVFISLSGVLIFGLVRREQRELAETNADLERTIRHSMVLHRLLRHNLRNSCDVIQNNVALLRSDRGDEADHRDRIQRQADNLESIATKSQQLRDVVFDDELDHLELDLVDVVEEGVTAARRAYPEATFVLDSPPSQRVVAHPRLSVAVEELLANAVDHHETGSPRAVVSVDSEGDEGVLRITDDGPGIPPVERTVLEGGVEDALTHSRGVGLWLVRFIVTASGGSLSVPATGDEGTVVSIRLPLSGQ